MDEIRNRNDLINILSTLVKSRVEIIFFVLCLIAAMIFVPNFANPQNLGNILWQSSELIILSTGMTFVFMNGGIDFSITAVLPLCSVIGAEIMIHMNNSGISVVLAVVTMLAIGFSIGVINGFSVTILKMPSFIATMATQLIFAGVALTITQSSTIGNISPDFLNIAQGNTLGLPNAAIITVLVVIITAYALHFTVYGRQIAAIGTNHRASIISGIPIKKRIFSLFVISSLLASLASIVMSAKNGAGMPGLGKDMLMDVIASVIIGGTSIIGGYGNIIGTVIGSILVLSLNNCLNLIGIDWYYINVCKGALILCVAMLDIMRNKNR